MTLLKANPVDGRFVVHAADDDGVYEVSPGTEFYDKASATEWARAHEAVLGHEAWVVDLRSGEVFSR